MDNLKVNWNDHIGEFVRLKATQPHILKAMLKRQQHHSQEKEIQRRLKHLKWQFQELQTQLNYQNNKLETASAKKSTVQTEINRIQGECASMEWQLLRNSKQLQKRHKTKSSRSSLNETSHTNSQRSIPFAKKDMLRKANLESMKHEMQEELQKSISYKISLKEQTESLAKRIANMHQNAKKNKKIEQIKKQIQNNLANQSQLRQQKLALIEKHRQKLIETQKPAKASKNKQYLLQESSKRIQVFLKEVKRLVVSQQESSINRYRQLSTKQSQRQLMPQRQYSRLLQGNPDLKNIRYQVLEFQQLERKMYSSLEIEQMVKREKKVQRQLQKYEQIIEQLREKQMAVDDEIALFQGSLEAKKQKLLKEANS